MRILASGSLKLKMMLAVSLLVTVILIVVGGINYYFWRSELKTTLSSQQNALVEALAGQLDDKLLSAQEQLAHFSRRIDRSVIENPHRFQATMEQDDDVQVQFDGGLLLVTPDGRVIAEYLHTSEAMGSNRSEREYFKQTIATGKPVISSPYLSTPHNKTTIAFTVPIFDEKRGITAILVGRHGLDSSQILSSLRQLKIGKSGYLYIIDKDRDMVLHPDPRRIMEVLPAGLNAGLDRSINGFEGTIENINSKGVKGLTTFKHLKSTNWILAANNPVKEAYAPLHRATIYALIILAGGILTSLIVVRKVTSRISLPILHLIEHLDDAKKSHNSWQPLEVKTGDEIERLADTFNALIDTLHKQNESLTVMQTEMQHQKAFVEGVLNKAAVPIFVLDTGHRIIVWNNAMEDLTGLKAEEMLGTNRQWLPFYGSERPVLADLVLSADDSHLEELYRTHRMSQHVSGGLQAEGWLENVGGRRRYLLFEAAPVLDAQNVKLGVVESLLDITERKLAEDEQRKLARAVSENPCSIVITDVSGTIEYVNRKFCELTGYTVEEAVGRNPRILKSGETPQEIYDEMWLEISQGKTWRGELKNRKKNGELYWELASISPVVDETGQITHYLAVKEDITQRKRSEVELAASKEALQEQHLWLNQIFSQMEKSKREWEDTMDCISDMVLMCDTFGKIKRCNRPLTELTGLPYEQVVERNWMSLLTGVGLQVVDFDGQHGNLFDPHSQRSFEVNVSPIRQPGSPLQSGTVVSIHDTTIMKSMNSKLEKAYAELQQTQSQIMQQEKMASIGQLAAGVAHEINNPMGFISSNLSSLGKYMEKISAFNAALLETVEAKGDLDTLNKLNDLRKKMKIDYILGDIGGLLAESHDGAERVRRIVQDLKSFSHVDDVQCKPFSINECLASTLNMARNEIKYIADVEQEYDPDLPLLNCYPQQLNQVFMNILVNAAHAMEGHGVISIKTVREADDVVVRISDTGKGIAPENLSRIFEPFFTTKEVGKGTGLGLSISYDIVKKHGGVMTVESEVGIGTTFIIRLPLNHQFTNGEVVS